MMFPLYLLRTTNFVAHITKVVLGIKKRDEDCLAAELVTQSMMNTPSYVEIFRGTEETRREPMEFLFRKNIYLVKQKCPECIHVFYDADHMMECFFMLVPSFGAYHTMYEKIVVGGILEFGLRYGLGTVMRLIKVSDYADSMENDFMKGRRFFSLQRMVVAKSKQGQGIGSKHLSNALKEADQLQLPVVLSTQDDRNIIFYGRLGFKVVLETTYKVSDGDDASYNYKTTFMVREPTPPAESK